MSIRGSQHAAVGGCALYPELVDGRVEGPPLDAPPVPSQPSGGLRAHPRRSNSLHPESLSVRRARNSLKHRKLGFTSVVLPDVQGQAGHSDDLAAAFGHDPPSGSGPSTPQRRASVHKLLSGTFSDPMSAHERRVVSAVTIQMSPSHDDCSSSSSSSFSSCAAAHNPPLTPRRSHSFRLLSHARGPRWSLSVASKQDQGGFNKEGMKEGAIKEGGFKGLRDPTVRFKESLSSSESLAPEGDVGTEEERREKRNDNGDDEPPEKREEKRKEETKREEGKEERTIEVARTRPEMGSESRFFSKVGVPEDNGNDVTEAQEEANMNELSESVRTLKVWDL
ncbi:uncharacterized protein LOC125025103 [Penaeus chinensis]|uniref:uncharacterized protein LOC125025103 n=1 Tax=Penaeus chinensis TaxID=139456 RepID=UPI001FB775ED|nr:uncharacterized protein LOC125025103 [Penaeus chinensis]